MIASVPPKKCLWAAIAGLVFVLAIELGLLINSCQENLRGYEMRREGYVFTKGSGFNPLKNIENSQVCLDWVGLERCRSILTQKGLWPLSTSGNQKFALLETLALQEADNSLNLYAQLYDRLSNAQLKIFLSPDDSLTPYACGGAEGSDIRTYTQAISILKRTANWQNYCRLQDLDALSEPIRGTNEQISAEEKKLRHYGKLELPPLNVTPLPYSLSATSGSSPERRYLLQQADKLELHPLRILIALEHLCLIDRHKLQTQQAQECLILLERLRVSSLRLSILHDEAVKLIPEKQWAVLLKEPELQELDKRFVQDLPYPKTLHLMKECLNSTEVANTLTREINPSIPPIEQEGPPPPPEAR